MNEREKAAYALYLMADNSQGAAERVRETDPVRAMGLVRAADLRRDMAQAILSGADWLNDVGQVHERLTEIYHLNVTVDRKPVPVSTAEHYVNLMARSS